MAGNVQPDEAPPRNFDPATDLRVEYIAYGDHRATAHLADCPVSGFDLLYAGYWLDGELSEEVRVEATLRNGIHRLEVSYLGNSGVTFKGRARLVELLRPRYGATGVATAKVIRSERRHIATVVTVRVTDGVTPLVDTGELEAAVNAATAKNGGVALVTWDASTREFKFEVAAPHADNVIPVIAGFGSVTGIYLEPWMVKPQDDDPEAANIRAFLWQNPKGGRPRRTAQA